MTIRTSDTILLLAIFIGGWVILSSCNTAECQIAEVASPLPVARQTATLTEQKIVTKHINSFIKKQSPNALGGFHLVKKQDRAYFAFITNDAKLELLDLTDTSAHHSINIGHLLGGEKFASLYISNDTVCILRPAARTISISKVKDDFTLSKTTTYPLNLSHESAGFYFMSNPGFRNLTLLYPYVIFPYGNSRKKNNIEPTAYISYNLQTNDYRKIISYPECYQNCAVPGTQSMLAVNHHSIVCIFRNHESVNSYDLKGALVKHSAITHACRFEEFDKSKETDLSYVRKYQLLSENNTQVLTDSRGHLLILKRLKGDSMDQAASYETFILNDQLEQTGTVKIQHSIYPYASFEYGKGFLIFGERLENAYYYVVQNN